MNTNKERKEERVMNVDDWKVITVNLLIAGLCDLWPSYSINIKQLS